MRYRILIAATVLLSSAGAATASAAVSHRTWDKPAKPMAGSSWAGSSWAGSSWADRTPFFTHRSTWV